MKTIASSATTFLRVPRAMSAALLIAVCSFSAPTQALEDLNDHDLSGVSGEGLSFPFENIRVQMAQTSFIELTGSAPAGGTTFKRGDVRYYGLAMSAGASSAGVIDNSAGVDWYGNGCTGGTFGLGCPMSSNGITNFSTVDNPYVLRVFEYDKMGTANALTKRTVLEFMGPSNTDPFRWAFWGEIESNRVVDGSTGATTTPGVALKSQSIILGKPTSRLKPPSLYGFTDASNPNQGSVLRLFQFQGDQSLGLTYTNRLSGDFRFSVNTTAVAGTTATYSVPDFTDQEGLYFNNVSAFLPLGQLHYQAITFNDTQSGTGGSTANGNFVIDLAAIPNLSNVIADFYSLPTALAANGSCNAACQTTAQGYNRVISAANANYFNTHGYVEWGTAFPTCSFTNCMSGSGVSTVRFAGTGGLTGAAARDDVIKGATGVTDLGGMSFLSSSATSTWTVLENQNDTGSTVRTMNAINLGTSRVEGLMISHMKLTTLGAN